VPSAIIVLLDGAIQSSMGVILNAAKDLMTAIIVLLDGAILSSMDVILSAAKDLTQQEDLDERRFSN